MSKDKVRIESLDGIRGIVAIVIVYFHVWALCGFANFSRYLNSIVSNFDAGVRFFFMLSAFALLCGYERSLFQNENNLKKFYMKRYLKIAPIFYLVTIIQMIINYFYNVRYSTTQLTMNASLLFALLPGNQEIVVGGSWAVSIEWLFYIFFPIFLIIVKSKHIFIIGLVGSLLITLGYDDVVEGLGYTNMHINIFRYLAYFFVGALVYKLIPYVKKFEENYYQIIKYLEVPLLIITLILSIISSKLVNKDLGMLVGFALIITFAIIGYSKFINNKGTRLIGRISYSIYLIHPLVIQGALKFNVINYIYNNISNKYIAYIIAGIIVVAISCLLSYFTTKYIEEELSKRLMSFIIKKENKVTNLIK